jgi:hypothetical protein
MRVKAKDPIQLSSGACMTLGEALDRGLVYVWQAKTVARKIRGERREVACYIAWERDADGDVVSWTIGQKLYESRRATAEKSPFIPAA